jgi:signal peptide peptidase SppA
MMTTQHISRNLLETPWAILPTKMEAIVEMVTRYFTGEKLSAEEVQMRVNGATRPSERTAGAIAVLPLFGTIVPRANLFTNASGATSAEIFGKRFDELINDPSVGAIILDVDSPGGQVAGIEEVSKKIFDARGRKPVVAVANHLAASAAYWIATAADELVVTPSGEVGSIGVFAAHEDMSESLAKEGIKVTMISEGKYKTEGNPYEPLSEESKAAIQERVAEVYDSFIKAVARNRGVKAADVREGFGEGRVVSAKKAVQLGMADRVGTLDETIVRMQKGMPRKAMSADVDFRRRRMRLMENDGSVEP